MRKAVLHLLLVTAWGAGAASSSTAAEPPANTAPLWSLQPIRSHELPPVSQHGWARRRVDFFLLAKLEQNELEPAPDADAATLLRRLYFDLIGLPPTLEEIESFARRHARDPEAGIQFEVERLLASPEFGVRWGRHWLDVARYAESSGNTRNMAYPLAWRYRNWVVRALNQNVPFDRFIRMQIAGGPAARW